MTTTSADAVLNDVLISLHRSLLQYVVDAWPWTDAHSEAHRTAVMTSAADQNEIVDRLAELLHDRVYPVTFGQYPDFSNLNYVSLDFLLKRIVQNQKEVVADCEEAARELAENPEDGALARKIAAAETERLKGLQELAAGSKP
jgi:hypothetical protein